MIVEFDLHVRVQADTKDDATQKLNEWLMQPMDTIYSIAQYGNAAKGWEPREVECEGCGTDLDADGACPCCEGARA